MAALPLEPYRKTPPMQRHRARAISLAILLALGLAPSPPLLAQAPAPAPSAPAVPLAPPAAPAPAPAPAAPASAEPVFPSVERNAAAPEAAKPRPKPKPKPAPPRETALSDDPTPALQPETFFTTSKASERYAGIVDAGGWPTIGQPLQPGAKGPAVTALRRRLAAEDDAISGTAPKWTPDLTAAVKRFQFRMGLRQTGVVAGATLKALDIPATTRFRQLASSAQRLAGVQFPLASVMSS